MKGVWEKLQVYICDGTGVDEHLGVMALQR